MSDVWEEPPGAGWAWGAAGSLLVHAALAAVLFLMPAEARDRILDKVDMTVVKKARVVPPAEKPPEPAKPEPEEKPEPAARLSPRPAPEPAPAEPPKPPPKFQMSGQTFAGDGTWGLAAEVGDNRFGSLEGEGEPDEGEEKAVEEGPAAVQPKKAKKAFDPAGSGEVKDKPQVVLEQQIPYPAEARKLGIEGKVRLRVDIDEKGHVVGVEVLDDPGGGLGKAAADALEGFLFSPAVAFDGKPVDYRITYTYIFKLE